MYVEIQYRALFSVEAAQSAMDKSHTSSGAVVANIEMLRFHRWHIALDPAVESIRRIQKAKPLDGAVCRTWVGGIISI